MEIFRLTLAARTIEEAALCFGSALQLDRLFLPTSTPLEIGSAVVVEIALRDEELIARGLAEVLAHAQTTSGEHLGYALSVDWSSASRTNVEVMIGQVPVTAASGPLTQSQISSRISSRAAIPLAPPGPIQPPPLALAEDIAIEIDDEFDDLTIPESRPRILIADDDKLVRKMLRVGLQKSGYEPIEAHDGAEALSLTREKNPDLLVLDVMMPKLTGFEVARMLAFDLRYSNIPILMLTARSESADRETGLKSGASEYLVKPVTLERLLPVIEKLLGQSRT